ncbi:MAG: hypothetical protein ACRDPG_02040 [Nocardioidaceae bacterium]
MGFFSRLLIPRSVRRAAHPVRTVKRKATPKVVKRARRALSPVDNIKYGVERSVATSLRSGRKGKKSKTGTGARAATTRPARSGTGQRFRAEFSCPATIFYEDGLTEPARLSANDDALGQWRCWMTAQGRKPGEVTRIEVIERARLGDKDYLVLNVTGVSAIYRD